MRYAARQQRSTGTVRRRGEGGDTRSRPIEANAAVAKQAVSEQSDVTLEELPAMLAGGDVLIAASTLCRFFRRHGITKAKRTAR